jgi:hypothetical protein
VGLIGIREWPLSGTPIKALNVRLWPTAAPQTNTKRALQPVCLNGRIAFTYSEIGRFLQLFAGTVAQKPTIF